MAETRETFNISVDYLIASTGQCFQSFFFLMCVILLLERPSAGLAPHLSQQSESSCLSRTLHQDSSPSPQIECGPWEPLGGCGKK